MSYNHYFNGNKVTFKTFKVVLSKPSIGWKQTYRSGFETEVAARAEARAILKKEGPGYIATVMVD